ILPQRNKRTCLKVKQLSSFSCMHLIGDAGKRFLPSEYGESVEDPRRCGPTGKGGSERLGDFGELVPRLVGKLPHCGLELLLRPTRHARKSGGDGGNRRA